MKLLHVTFVSLVALGVFSAASAHAQEKANFTAELTGMYALEGQKTWQLLGPGYVPTNKSGVGDGEVGRVALGYQMGDFDITLAAQHGDLSKGDPSAGAASTGFLGANYEAVDAMAGYTTTSGASETRWAVGIRAAKWDNEINTIFPGELVNHKWEGIGPRGEFQTDMPLSGAFSLQYGAGLAYMWGDLKLTASPVWFCDDCQNYDADSWSVDGSISVKWKMSPSTALVAGYRAEFWSDVNVKITDNSGNGLNQGTSSHLVQGPFASLKLKFG